MGDFEELITAAATRIAPLIPAAPAAELGRRTAPRRRDERTGGSVVQQALRDIPRLTAERLLGALELAVAELDVVAPHELVAGLRPVPAGHTFSYLTSGGESAMQVPMTLVEGMHPGASDLVVDQVLALLPDLSGLDGDEAAIATRRGAVHLSTAVAVSRAVLTALGSTTAADPAAVVGIALGAASEVLAESPLPHAYEQALLDKRRAEYRGSSWSTVVPVFDHEFLLVEELGPSTPDFTATGLAAPVDTGFAVRTGIARGEVPVSVAVLLEEPPEPLPEGWDEIAEISYTAARGGARFGRGSTPPWGGPFRVRVSATGRDEGDERYELLIWPAPIADPVLRLKTDRVGHLVRGEPAPPPIVRPEAPHRWLKRLLEVAATVTVARGVTDVAGEFDEDAVVVEIDGGVVVVEDNNYRGTRPEVLERLSRNGKAASHFWNVNSDRQLSFARGGQVLWSGDVLDEDDFGDDPEVLRAVEGLDFTDWRHLDAKGITAVARFTGAAVPEDAVRAAVEERYQ
ncbi:DUF6461 domain-containing protein [Lentzea sp. CC55]|uniref:DUF6461 domain-containing protein n=1 Tax=Lentzea sp. CC55 TaxID=2884909 RepID=UPI001F3F5B97|nr:DUF6461 domain-containing protein [Lentzea sp. CC55]MCG8925313.1 DUF6461 domain-containing protein [Lentzea sp. CC55]